MPGEAFSVGFGAGFGGPHNFGTLQLKIGTVGPDPAYQDGDIICAFNRRRCRCVHAQHICHPWKATPNAHGLLALSTVVQDYFENTHQFRFERVSRLEVLRTNLITLNQDLLSGDPNEDGESIDVVEYLARRKRFLAPNGVPKKPIFGEEGAEVWYGGRVDESHAKLDAIWNAIETKTPLREVDHADWPAGTEELKTTLFIRVNDFTDDGSQSLVAPVEDLGDPDNPVVLKKRARRVQWRRLRDMSTQRVAEIEDRDAPVDIRGLRKHVLTIVEAK